MKFRLKATIETRLCKESSRSMKTALIGWHQKSTTLNKNETPTKIGSKGHCGNLRHNVKSLSDRLQAREFKTFSRTSEALEVYPRQLINLHLKTLSEGS